MSNSKTPNTNSSADTDYVDFTTSDPYKQRATNLINHIVREVNEVDRCRDVLLKATEAALHQWYDAEIGIRNADPETTRPLLKKTQIDLNTAFSDDNRSAAITIKVSLTQV